MISKLKIYIALIRPFTLLPPALGMISGSFVTWKTMGVPNFLGIVYMLLGAISAAILNGASNSLNQIYDLEIDRINKPERPLPANQLTIKEAWGVTLFCYIVALLLAYFITWGCFAMVSIAAFCTIIYSMPPLRTKRHWLAAALTIAIPRGMLLKVAGWSVLGRLTILEPWYIGLIFGLFLLGATTTKDYADMKGDQKNGCSTLPIRFGILQSIYIISPCFVAPFLLLPIGVVSGILTGNPIILWALGIILILWGLYVVKLLFHDPHSLAATENHPSWTQMYRMMMFAQTGLMIAYIV